ncbi:hypothetical protein ILUMI_25600 [Ignelater luminosus]|uniref:Metalloendopeptidase n=1 Tax=Ignelater luminosus TaxID=2038154 RepID=A0A8K0FZI1_IGNLU|nr:hypothetical protein ILUMI_25600 [Ignelater luminosus]
MKFAQPILAAILLQCVACTPLLYKQLTPEEAQRLASWTLEDKEPMWQISGQYEGDIILEPGQLNGLTDKKKRWRNREIPYELSSDFTTSEKQFINNSLKKEYAKTCITVRPRRSTDSDYVYVTGKNTGCWSKVGRVKGRQELNLQRNGCLWHGTIVHEFLHAAGFHHQQSDSDRDKWVKIIKENIQKGKERNFKKYKASVVSSFGERYDYGSIMHYNKYAFSKNGLATIVPHDPKAVIGQRNGLSATDIAKLNKMYGCS